MQKRKAYGKPCPGLGASWQNFDSVSDIPPVDFYETSVKLGHGNYLKMNSTVTKEIYKFNRKSCPSKMGLIYLVFQGDPFFYLKLSTSSRELKTSGAISASGNFIQPMEILIWMTILEILGYPNKQCC